MYDHLPPRLAKYLARIYTGTDVPEIERKDVRSRVDEFANVWRSYARLERWNNAHKREIAQLQSKLHDRRVEVKRLQKQVDVFNGLLELKNQRINGLLDALYNERRRARELRAFASETTNRLTEVATDALETFSEHDSDWEFK